MFHYSLLPLLVALVLWEEVAPDDAARTSPERAAAASPAVQRRVMCPSDTWRKLSPYEHAVRAGGPQPGDGWTRPS